MQIASLPQAGEERTKPELSIKSLLSENGSAQRQRLELNCLEDVHLALEPPLRGWKGAGEAGRPAGGT